MKILLTGTTGLLGSALFSTLSDHGHVVVPFVGDLREEESLQRYRKPFDWVIHAAAITNVDQCEKDKKTCWAVNAIGTKSICDIAREAGAGFVYISTASVFSGEEGNYSETSTPEPKNFYNSSKFAGEQFASEYNRTIIVRLTVIGIHKKGSRGQNFLEWLVDSFKHNKDMTLFTDVRINPLSNLTLAEYIEKIISTGRKEAVLHLTSRDVLSKAEIGKLVQNRFPEYRSRIEYIKSDLSSVARPREMWLNGDHSAELYSLSRPSISEEIDRIFENRKDAPV